MRARPVFLMLLLAGPAAGRADVPAPERAEALGRALLDRTLEETLVPDLSRLEREEREALELLPEAGRQVQDICHDQKHPRAARLRAAWNSRFTPVRYPPPDQTVAGSLP